MLFLSCWLSDHFCAKYLILKGLKKSYHFMQFLSYFTAAVGDRAPSKVFCFDLFFSIQEYGEITTEAVGLTLDFKYLEFYKN